MTLEQLQTEVAVRIAVVDQTDPAMRVYIQALRNIPNQLIVPPDLVKWPTKPGAP